MILIYLQTISKRALKVFKVDEAHKANEQGQNINYKKINNR